MTATWKVWLTAVAMLAPAAGCADQTGDRSRGTCASTVTEEALCALRLHCTTRAEFDETFCGPLSATPPDQTGEAVLVFRYRDAARTASLSFWFRGDLLVNVSVLSSSNGDVRLPPCLRSSAPSCLHPRGCG